MVPDFDKKICETNEININDTWKEGRVHEEMERSEGRVRIKGHLDVTYMLT